MKTWKKVVLIVLAVLIVGGVVGQQVLYRTVSDPSEIIKYETDNPYIVEKGETMVSAHRSGAGIMPEETMMAFKNCVESEKFDTDVFEFDLHITKDDILVLLHDGTLDRTSDSEKVFGEKKVRPEDKTYEELRALNMGAKFTNPEGEMPYADLSGDEVPDDLRIVRVEDVLDFLMANGDFDYIIEIKNSGDLGRKGVDILCEILKEKNLLDRVAFGTFHPEISKYVDENHPELKRSATIFEVLGFYTASLVGKKNFDVNYIALQIPYKLAIFNLGTARVINYAHKNNLAVQYWTINEKEDIEYLYSIGADCIMSDYPDDASEVIHATQNPAA